MDELPLKDIHLPEVISWWPPALGWWLLAIVVPLLIGAGVFQYRRLKRKTALKTARNMLADLRRDPQANSQQTLIALSALLRRVAISSAPRSRVASLKGEAWLAYLDASLPDSPFRQGVGRCLADAPYRPIAPNDIDLDALFELCERWLKSRAGTKHSQSLPQRRRAGLGVSPDPTYGNKK